MSEDVKTPEVKTPPKRGGSANFRAAARKGRTAGARSLTPSQKAEAAALWRTGETTLDQLAKKFSKRPETFSRLFKEMGISKGEAAVEHQKKVAQAVETQLLKDSETIAHQIATTKARYTQWINGLGNRVVRVISEQTARGAKLEAVKGEIQTLNLAVATLSKVREEMYVLLQVEKHDNQVDDDELPELTVRELTQKEVLDLQGASVSDGLDVDDSMLDDDLADDPEPTQGPATGGR